MVAVRLDPFLGCAFLLCSNAVPGLPQTVSRGSSANVIFGSDSLEMRSLGGQPLAVGGKFLGSFFLFSFGRGILMFHAANKPFCQPLRPIAETFCFTLCVSRFGKQTIGQSAVVGNLL